MTNPIIKSRHAAYNTPARIIFGLIQDATNQTPQRYQQIVKGYDNEVYAVKTRPGEAFILRISRHGQTDFAAEAWALEKCRAAGVPVPELCWLDTVDIEGQMQGVMVQRKLPGQALSELQGGLSRPTWQHILHQAGTLLSRINRIPVKGFYKRGPDGRWDFPDWAGVMTAALRDRAAEKACILGTGFTEAEFAMMLTWLRRYKEAFPCRQPVLCHGDFSPDHIFIDETMTISGLIDFGEFQGGPPVHDLAYFSFEAPELDLSFLQAGYEDNALFDDHFGLRLQLHKLALQMGYLAYYVKSGNIMAAKPAAKGLQRTLQTLQEALY